MQMQKFPKITLAAARVNAGLSQQEAAKALGVSVATLQNYESGKTVPQWGTVQKIETVYNFPADFIFSDTHQASVLRMSVFHLLSVHRQLFSY